MESFLKASGKLTKMLQKRKDAAAMTTKESSNSEEGHCTGVF